MQLIDELIAQNARNNLISELSEKIDASLENLNEKQLKTIVSITKEARLIQPTNDKSIISIEISDQIYRHANSVYQNMITKKVESLLNNYSLDDMTDWSHFIVRDKKWDQLQMYNTGGTQEPYGKRMQRAVTLISDLIRAETSFDKICEYSAILRRLIAKELGHESPEDFGIKRGSISSPETPLGGVYRELGDYWKNQEIIEDSPFYKINKSFPSPNMYSIKIVGDIKGEKFELSEILFKKYGKDTYVSVVHTYGENIPIIMDHVGELYNLALKEQDPEKIKEIAGTIFWWICQAKPWDRGDPSIAEIIIRSLFEVKGIPNQPWKEGIIPWVEAMKDCGPETFGKRFSDLFAF